MNTDRTWFALGTACVEETLRPVMALERGVFDLEQLLASYPHPLAGGHLKGDIDGLLQNCAALGPDLDAIARHVQHESARARPLPAEARLTAPIRPGRIFAAASNYIEHADEMGTVLANKANSAPYMFMKATTSIIGQGHPIVLPARAKKVDWEVELAAVIGRGGRNIAVESALDHVVGYTVLNDISARDLTRRDDYPFKFDWFQGKSFDTFAPFGPWIVPSHLIGDPQRLRLTLRVNGVVKQDGGTDAMIFSVAEQIAYLSSILTLIPGDVIATGTPAGVGLASGTFLKPGDVVAAEIEKIGELINPVVAE
jgi:2-keto-4-pentenoate hydratase/2-oxohepta-3-ene-1,7-dioic acid hydratase in catechol pathway